MKIHSLSLHLVSFAFLMAASTCGFAQGGGGAANNLQAQVTALQQQVAALQAALNTEIAAHVAAINQLHPERE
jgi:hypothetical protein